MLNEEQRVDWFRLLDDLKRCGKTLEEISRATLIAKATLVLYRNPVGSEPSHAKGERLIAYWCQQTGRHRNEIPIERIVYSAAGYAK